MVDKNSVTVDLAAEAERTPSEPTMKYDMARWLEVELAL
jgi:hypothetical protein